MNKLIQKNFSSRKEQIDAKKIYHNIIQPKERFKITNSNLMESLALKQKKIYSLKTKMSSFAKKKKKSIEKKEIDDLILNQLFFITALQIT
ncbi:hypothetical protein Glove_441g125 [Diversispora epigaea]|uniref:Uncharacterized protein n=1 Tax=Diversispora epigaea TaxID=1348612 RepID=A0A397GR30_9GLOM|nr:hypothetical protein Glove_441g125 [Diversispora epigaea]